MFLPNLTFRLPGRYPLVLMYAPLLIRLEIAIVTVRWRLARPVHLWVGARITRTLQFLPTTCLSVEDC